MSMTPAVMDGETGRVFATGWIPDPAAVAKIVHENGIKAFSQIASRIMYAMGDTDSPAFFWDAEKKVLGKVLPSWNQGQVGSCVSFGYGRAAQDLMLLEIANGEAEKWPDYEVATEPIYGGSRVEVGGGQISGDGSIGAWAAKFVKDWGILIRQKYTFNAKTYDLEKYNETRCREYGRHGVPDALEPEARIHPVTDVALVRTADEIWAALGASKPIPVCSMQGFTTTLSGGFCEPSGQWAHCMAFRGRFVHPSRGKCVVIQNSWGGYLSGNRTFSYLDGGATKQAELPEGCFCTTLTVAARMASEGDTFALAGFKGWDVPAPVPPNPGPTPPSPPVPPGPAPVGLTGSLRFVNGVLVEIKP